MVQPLTRPAPPRTWNGGARSLRMARWNLRMGKEKGSKGRGRGWGWGGKEKAEKGPGRWDE
jgi:hypothetical protein